jgi:hypothetical protein
MASDLLLDPNWTPELGQILVVSHNGRLRSDYPFVQVTQYTPGHKTFKVRFLSGYVSEISEMVSLFVGEEKSEHKYKVIRPALNGDTPEEGEKFVFQTYETECKCQFSRKRDEPGWRVNINGARCNLSPFDPTRICAW